MDKQAVSRELVKIAKSLISVKKINVSQSFVESEMKGWSRFLNGDGDIEVDNSQNMISWTLNRDFIDQGYDYDGFTDRGDKINTNITKDLAKELTKEYGMKFTTKNNVLPLDGRTGCTYTIDYAGYVYNISNDLSNYSLNEEFVVTKGINTMEGNCINKSYTFSDLSSK